MKNLSVASRIYGLAGSLLLIVATLSGFAYSTFTEAANQLAELDRVNDATTKVMLAERDFAAMRLRFTYFMQDGREVDLQRFQEIASSSATTIGEAIQLIRPGDRRAAAEQILRVLQDTTSVANGLLRNRNALKSNAPALNAMTKASRSEPAEIVSAILLGSIAAASPSATTLAAAKAATDAAAALPLNEADQRSLRAVQDATGAIAGLVAGSEGLDRQLEPLRAMFADFRTKQLARADELSATIIKNGDHTRRLLLIVSVLAVVLGAILAWIVARGLIQPITQMTSAMTRLAAGDGSVDIPGMGATNEIGRMASAVDVFKQNADKIAAMLKAEDTTREIGSVISKAAGGDLTIRVDLAGKSGFLRDIGEQVNTLLEASHSAFRDFGDKARTTAFSVGEASAAVSQVSDGARAQNKSLFQVATAIGETMVAIQGVAQNTRMASEKAEAAAKLVEHGLVSVESLAGVVDRIAQNSRKVSQITQVISQIANRTHILSLNAAIEAARAGEHGKGFVVVAQEVGKLAESAGQNANQISEIVEQAANDTQTGKTATEQVRTAIKGISDQTLVTMQMIHSSAAAIEEQRASIAQIDSTVSELKGIANSNAAASEEITATMVQLSRLAEDARRRIDAYKMS